MRKIKVVTGKISLDDHFRGIISVTQAMRNAGMEVVYLGTGQRIDGVINSIIQEDAEVVGLSFLCGGQVEIMRRFMGKMHDSGLDDVVVVVGGIIHTHEVPLLKDLGVKGIFLPGTSLTNITDFIIQTVKEQRQAREAGKKRSSAI